MRWQKTTWRMCCVLRGLKCSCMNGNQLKMAMYGSKRQVSDRQVVRTGSPKYNLPHGRTVCQGGRSYGTPLCRRSHLSKHHAWVGCTAGRGASAPCLGHSVQCSSWCQRSELPALREPGATRPLALPPSNYFSTLLHLQVGWVRVPDIQQQ